MTSRSIGFIGGGRIVSIFLGGWRRAGALPGKIAVFDPDIVVTNRLKERQPGIETVKEIGEVGAREIVFLAVHPPAITETLKQIKHYLDSSAILISLAPKFSIAGISEMLGGHDRIVRTIPNAPSIVGRGYNPISFSPGSVGEKEAVLEILRP